MATYSRQAAWPSIPLRRFRLSDQGFNRTSWGFVFPEWQPASLPSFTKDHPMSKHTVSTKGGAMVAEGHKTRRAALSSQAGASALAISTISAIAGALRDPILYRD